MTTDLSAGKKVGGLRRAESLTPARRSEIAKLAAESRWRAEIPKATHTGALTFGNEVIACAVLPDGTRVLSQRGVGKALNRSYGGANWKRQDLSGDPGGGNLPFFLSATSLNPFISNDLLVLISQPVQYRHGQGGGAALGVPATALPQICDAWLRAREAGALKIAAQLKVAQKAEILMRSLAQVGIVALVDEATGYQEVRARDALQAYLERFIRAELAAWVKMFPDEFFRELYRLKRWPWTGSTRRPGIVGHYINDLVYKRLGPGVLEELQRKNPVLANGRRKGKHTQLLTEDLGHPALSQHMFALLGFMRAEDDWDSFRLRFYRAYPERGDTLQLPF